MIPRPRLLGFACALVAAVTTSCTAATPDESLAGVTTTAVATATTVPSGTAAELLPRLDDLAHALSGVMIDDGDAGAVVDEIEALWTAARIEVGAARPDLLESFDVNVALARKAVQFSRAADADKAARNVTALVDTFLAG
ncbi:MAG: hypothetical protein KDB40_15860 [Acidimicrobiales bacterium]|nr:hypothetical protein [Acidimicrobiales bacterium]